MALAHFMILGLGGLLIGIPILLHFLMRPKPRSFLFPALRFVRELHQTNQRSLRLRHWLLLMLRCLLLLALAAAFAKPSTASGAFGNWLGLGAGAILSVLTGLLLLYSIVFSKPANLPMAIVVSAVLALLIAYTAFSAKSAFSKNSGHVLADQQTPVATLLLIDSSPRMSYIIENQSLMEKVQDFGRWLIGQLPLGSRVAIAETDGEKPFFSVDISAARKRLNTLDINFSSVPIPETLELAIRFLSKTEYERKEIYVFSDLTRVSWENNHETLNQLLEDYPDISLFVIDVGVKEPQNYSLDELQMSANSIPMQGELEISTQVRSYGVGKSLLMKMMLEKPDSSLPRRVDGETVVPDQHWTRVTNVTVGDNSVTSARISLQDDLEAGVHHGWLEIDGGDSLEADDRRYFTIEVRPSWPVLVAHPADVNPDNLTDALETANGMYSVRTIAQEDLAGEPLADYSAVFLLDPEPVTDPLWRILEDYVDSGGGLAVFLGHNALGDNGPDPAFQTEAAAAVLPGRLVRDWIRKQGDLQLSLDNLAHPVLREFRPMASLGIWQPFPVFRHWEIDTGSDPAVEVIARYTNGIASLLQRRIGGGKVICMTTPITEPVRPEDRSAWNDLFNSSRGKRIWPAVFLISEISDYLASGTRDRINVSVGQSVTIFNDVNLMPSEYRMFSPRDEDPVRIASADNLLRYKFTDTPGNYRLKGQVENNPPVIRGFSVNMANNSTDLQRIEETLLTGILGEDRFQLARERDEIERQQGTTRLGQEFYPTLVLMMCLLLAMELVMSNRFYKN